MFFRDVKQLPGSTLGLFCFAVYDGLLNLKLFFFDDCCRGLLSKTINVINLESEQQQESHHKTEKSHSFGQSESQDGI
jgi:hypothetical protein